MTNKIKISRELADRLTRAYPAEITDQETMQAIRIEALAALDELRAILAAPAVERQEQVGHVSYIGSGFVRVRTTECLAIEQPLYTSPPAPVAVVIDERAEFEKSVIGKAERFHPDLSKYGIDGEYKHAQLQYAWDLWQSRACLDKVKEMNK